MHHPFLRPECGKSATVAFMQLSRSRDAQLIRISG
jgi:hypothetical protein